MDVVESNARLWPSKVSYYRFSGYWYPCRIRAGNDTFVPGTSFADVTALYEADR
ncbi:Abi family protein [Corynebacterium epidermidicanis]|uniref:Abi family protein n=1 Tax=Corynebacterium epidermidicanis TaxID=1050174 RepID=UPI000A057045|nr:Abi family protein [Corynebacterium epidermidicanis]